MVQSDMLCHATVMLLVMPIHIVLAQLALRTSSLRQSVP